MDIFITDYSLWTLFFLGFAAATLLPLGSEWLLVVLITNGYPITETVLTATAGNYLGACTTYAIGIWGSTFVTTKIFRIDKNDSLRAVNIYKKWGVWSLLFSWLPVIGDPLCLVAGSFKLRFFPFSILVFLGKGLRYLLLAIITDATFAP